MPILLDVTFFQLVKFPAQNHNCSDVASVAFMAATAGDLMFSLHPDAPEERKQALG